MNYGVQESVGVPIPAHIKRGMQNKFDELLATSSVVTTIQSDISTVESDLSDVVDDVSALDERVTALEEA